MRVKKIKLPRELVSVGRAREFRVNELICIENEDSDDDGGWSWRRTGDVGNAGSYLVESREGPSNEVKSDITTSLIVL